MGKVDHLVGFKENVITGHPIPAGTGDAKLQNIRLKYLGTEIEVEEVPGQKPERSYEEIAADWRDSDTSEDVLPDEAREFIVDDELDGFDGQEVFDDEN